jgi:hypothetical protein
VKAQILLSLNDTAYEAQIRLGLKQEMLKEKEKKGCREDNIKMASSK